MRDLDPKQDPARRQDYTEILAKFTPPSWSNLHIYTFICRAQLSLEEGGVTARVQASFISMCLDVWRKLKYKERNPNGYMKNIETASKWNLNNFLFTCNTSNDHQETDSHSASPVATFWNTSTVLTHNRNKRASSLRSLNGTIDWLNSLQPIRDFPSIQTSLDFSRKDVFGRAPVRFQRQTCETRKRRTDALGEEKGKT